MTIVDDRILEYIQENEHGSASEMKKKARIPYSRQYISERCRKLTEHRLLRAVGNGVYVITERGEAYLDGDLDTHEDAQDNGPSVTETDSTSASEESEDTA